MAPFVEPRRGLVAGRLDGRCISAGGQFRCGFPAVLQILEWRNARVLPDVGGLAGFVQFPVSCGGGNLADLADAKSIRLTWARTDHGRSMVCSRAYCGGVGNVECKRDADQQSEGEPAELACCVARAHSGDDQRFAPGACAGSDVRAKYRGASAPTAA